jgi:hypothetical protein
LFTGADDVLRGKIVAVRSARWIVRHANSAFRADEDFFAQARVFPQHFPEGALGAAPAIDIGVIEERVTGFDRGQNRGAGGFEIFLDVAGGGETPAPVGQATGLEFAFSERNLLHNPLRSEARARRQASSPGS